MPRRRSRRAIDPQAIADLRLMGAPEALLAKLGGGKEDDGRCPVLRTNGPILNLFLALSTQWRWATRGAAGMGGVLLRADRIGLDYAAIEPTARLAGLQVTPQIFDGLRLMEAAAIEEFGRIAAERA